MSRNFGGGTMMIWAAFYYSSKISICCISIKIKSDNYINLLEEVLIDFGEQLSTDNWIFQQDNAAIHKARRIAEWLQQKNIEVLEEPSRSPDLNPIENLWENLNSKVYDG